MKFNPSFYFLLLMTILLSIGAGFINYNYITPKDIAKSYTSSSILTLPSNEQENTIILTNKGLKEWSSLADIQTNTNEQVTQNPKKVETFDIKYNQDISLFMKNYYSQVFIQSKLLKPLDINIDYNSERPSINIIQLGNGKIVIEKTFDSIEKATKFPEIVQEEQNNLIKDLNLTRDDKSQIKAGLQNKVYLTENAIISKKSPIQFLSGFILIFSILFYLITTFKFSKNKLN